MFDFLTSTKRPAAGTVALPSSDVLSRLKALNRESAPWRIVDGSADGVDLIAEWKIVDAQWYEIFAKAGLSKIFRILLKLDPSAKQVRAQDREYEVSWSAGIPSLSVQASGFKGQSTSVQFGASYGFKEDLSLGQQYEYFFKTSEIKGPVQQVVVDCGWVYKGVVFGKP
jgi:outer membrane protein TolC